MRTSPPSKYLVLVLCMGTLLLAMSVIAGCSQPVAPPAIPTAPPIQIFPTATPQPTPSVVDVVKTDASHVLVTFNGGPDRANIIELDATVTDSRGESQTQHIGDRLATSPVGAGGTIKFNGNFSGNVHITIAAWYANGSSKQLMDADI